MIFTARTRNSCCSIMRVDTFHLRCVLFAMKTACTPNYYASFISIFAGFQIAAFVTNLLSTALFSMTRARQLKRMREAYFKAVLCQEAAFFDTATSTTFSGAIQGDSLTVSEGIGERLGVLLVHLGVVVSGLVIGFITGYRMCFVMCAMLPLQMCMLSLVSRTCCVALSPSLFFPHC
jgi:ABC-type multidrug transport system fused ATPase/permease subunit